MAAQRQSGLGRMKIDTIIVDKPIHVFFVHSHITLICAMGIIRAETLADRDVRLVLLRDYRADTPFSTFSFPFPASRDSPSLLFGVTLDHIRHSRSRLAELDEFVGNISDGRPVQFYFPQTRRDFYHLLITHPRCTGFSVMEEGTSSSLKNNGYTRPSALGLNEHIKLMVKRATMPLLYGQRAQPRGEFTQSFAFIGRGAEKYYALSDTAFPGAPRREVLDLATSCEAVAPYLSAPDLPDEALVLVLCDLIFAEESKFDDYLQELEDQIARAVSKRSTHVVFKHHPSPSPHRDTVNAHIQAAADRFGISASELDRDVCLELLAARAPSLIFAGRSSVTQYAQVLGARQL